MNSYPLEAVASVIRGVTFSKAEGSPISTSDSLPVIRAGSIQQSLLLDEGQIWVPAKKVRTHQLIRKNDIVMCTSSGSSELVGKCAKSIQDWNGSFGAFCAGIRADESKCNSSYLYHFLCSPLFRNWTKTSSGANIKNIRASELASFEIPLPPLEEQKRIAAILDKADAIRRKRQQAIDLTDQLLRFVFLDMFGDPVTNPKGLKAARICEVGEIITGNTPSRKKVEYFGSYIEWIKSDNINTPSHYLTKATEFLSEDGLIVGRQAPRNSILVTCIAGSKDCIGNVAITKRAVAFNQQINAIVPNKNILTLFLYAQLWTNKKLVQRASTESMKGMVSKSKFSDIEILLPSMQEQEKYAGFFLKSMNSIESMEVSKKKVDEMFNGLTQQIFRGELTKQTKAA